MGNRPEGLIRKVEEEEELMFYDAMTVNRYLEAVIGL
jgi:hypothetical protein